MLYNPCFVGDDRSRLASFHDFHEVFLIENIKAKKNLATNCTNKHEYRELADCGDGGFAARCAAGLYCFVA